MEEGMPVDYSRVHVSVRDEREEDVARSTVTAGDLVGTITSFDGIAVPDLAYEWRDMNSTVYHSARTGARGEWSVPEGVAKSATRFLRAHVSDFVWIDYSGLDPSVTHTLSIPEMGLVDVHVRMGVEADFDAMRLRLYCSVVELPSLGSSSSVKLSMDSFSHPLTSNPCTIALPRSGLYRITCTSDRYRIGPECQLLRPPGAVSFDILGAVLDPLLELTENGQRAAVNGVVLLAEAGGDSITQLDITNGAAVIPAPRLLALRKDAATSFITILVEDGRLLEGGPADYAWDATRRVLYADLGKAKRPVVVMTGRAEDPQYVLGGKWDDVRFPVNGGASIGERGSAVYRRDEALLCFHRLPDNWATLKLVYKDGSVIVVEHLLGDDLRVKDLASERVLELDFERAVKPLVGEHGRLLVKFELQADSHPKTLLSTVDMISIETPGDCDGKSWRKTIVEGARGEITTQILGRRVVLEK
jgi:hypothetical protein